MIWYRVKVIHALIAALVVISIVLGYVIWTKPKEVIVNDPPTAEDIAKATAPMRADRDAEKQRADNAQSQQAAAKKTVDDLTNELNSARAQLGPRSPIMRLDDARRWQIVKSMVEGLPGSTQQGCQVVLAYDMHDQANYHKSANVWGEVQEPLFLPDGDLPKFRRRFFLLVSPSPLELKRVMPTSAQLALKSYWMN